MSEVLLRVENLSTVLHGSGEPVRAVDGVDLEVRRGETFAIVGESGSGKTMTALSLMRLLPETGRIVAGTVELSGVDLLALPEAAMRAVRGRRIAMVFQEPATSLNSVLTVGTQIREVLERHTDLRGARLEERVLSLLDSVGVPDAGRRVDEYPFQLSGGLRQRAMIAMAVAAGPDLLIADEPTSALDVTIQAQVLELLRELQKKNGMAILLITHDLGIVAETAHRVAVMRAGRVVEVAQAQRFFASPAHPYSRKLLEALPGRRATAPGESMRSAPLLLVRNLSVHFPVRKGLLGRTVGRVKAVDGVSLDIGAGRTLGLVGESGCGKTTVGKAIVQLIRPTAGDVEFGGVELTRLRGRALRAHRRDFQIIFQDPYASLDPRMRVADILAEGMASLGIETNAGVRLKRVAEILDRVGLARESVERYPHELSGGQRQRIAIARALAVQPKLIVCDEPTSALDMPVQAQILDLLKSLQRDLGLSYLFITHNLAVVEYLAHEVAVMYLGRIVERGTTEEVLRAPKHPYTQALLAAVPKIEVGGVREVIRLEGELPSPVNPPSGCHFHPRCPKVMPECRERYPENFNPSGTRSVACWLYQKES